MVYIITALLMLTVVPYFLLFGLFVLIGKLHER